MRFLCQEFVYPGGSVNTRETQGYCSVISAIDGLAEEVIQWVRASGGMAIKDSFPGQGHMCKGTVGTGKTICHITGCF